MDRSHCTALVLRLRPIGTSSSRRPERGLFLVDGMVDAVLLCGEPHLRHWSVVRSSWSVALLGHVLLNECSQGVGRQAVHAGRRDQVPSGWMRTATP